MSTKVRTGEGEDVAESYGGNVHLVNWCEWAPRLSSQVSGQSTLCGSAGFKISVRQDERYDRESSSQEES